MQLVIEMVKKFEYITELKGSKGQDSRNPETASLSAWVKDSVAGGFVVSCCSKWSCFATW